MNYTWQDPSKPHEIEWWPSKQENIKTTAIVKFDGDGTANFPYGLDISTIVDSKQTRNSILEDFDDISAEASLLMSSSKQKTSNNNPFFYQVVLFTVLLEIDTFSSFYTQKCKTLLDQFHGWTSAYFAYNR